MTIDNRIELLVHKTKFDLDTAHLKADIRSTLELKDGYFVEHGGIFYIGSGKLPSELTLGSNDSVYSPKY